MKVDVFAIQWKDKSLPSRVLLDVKSEILLSDKKNESIAELLEKKYHASPRGFYISYEKPARRLR